MQLVLDTTVLIDALRQRPGVVERLRMHRRAGDVACTTPINIEEVVRGLRPEEEEGARRLIEGLVIVPLGRLEGWRAGAWRRLFAAQGTTLSQSDCLIAAATFFGEGRLVTGSPKDFPMTEIEVEHWPVGQ